MRNRDNTKNKQVVIPVAFGSKSKNEELQDEKVNFPASLEVDTNKAIEKPAKEGKISQYTPKIIKKILNDTITDDELIRYASPLIQKAEVMYALRNPENFKFVVLLSKEQEQLTDYEWFLIEGFWETKNEILAKIHADLAMGKKVSEHRKCILETYKEFGCTPRIAITHANIKYGKKVSTEDWNYYQQYVNMKKKR